MTSEKSLKRGAFTTVLVMVCTLATRLLGFVRSAVIAAIFGASGHADVLNAVFTIPNNLRKLLAEGALSSAFIPVLSQSIVCDSTGKKAHRLCRNIITFQFLVLTPFLLLCIVFAQPIMKVFLEFPESWKMNLAVDLFRWLISYILFISLSAVIMAVLNSHGIFVVPALTPVFFSIAVISSILFLYKTLNIFSIAVGVLSGGLIQVLFQLPFFKKIGYDLKFEIGWNNEDFKRVLKLWIPVVITSSVFAINHIVAIRFASGLEQGSASALMYAIIFWQFPFGIFSASITTVLFPKMSRQAALKDKSGMAESLSYGMRFLLILLIPSAIFFIIMGKEIICIALQRGKFTIDNTILTAWVLTGYSIGLLSVGAFNFIQRFYYALKDYKTPFLIAIFVTIVDISISIWLKESILRVTGLAVANSVAFTCGLCFMLYFAKKKLGRICGVKIIITLIKVIISMIPAVSAILIYYHITSGSWTEGSSFQNLFLLLGGFFIFTMITLAMYFIMRIEILRDILRGRINLNYKRKGKK